MDYGRCDFQPKKMDYFEAMGRVMKQFKCKHKQEAYMYLQLLIKYNFIRLKEDDDV